MMADWSHISVRKKIEKIYWKKLRMPRHRSGKRNTMNNFISWAFASRKRSLVLRPVSLSLEERKQYITRLLQHHRGKQIYNGMHNIIDIFFSIPSSLVIFTVVRNEREGTLFWQHACTCCYSLNAAKKLPIFGRILQCRDNDQNKEWRAFNFLFLFFFFLSLYTAPRLHSLNGLSCVSAGLKRKK